MSDVTRILAAINGGDEHAARDLLPVIYAELRRLAARDLSREAAGQTLQATALVHEAYLRLVDSSNPQKWDGRWHFFAAASEAMRRILIENARRKHRQKRGGDRQRVDLDKVELTIDGPQDDLLALDEALNKLADKHPDKAKLVQLRYFGGLTNQEAAEAIGISVATAERHWAFARAWLYRQMAADEPSG